MQNIRKLTDLKKTHQTYIICPFFESRNKKERILVAEIPLQFTKYTVWPRNVFVLIQSFKNFFLFCFYPVF